MSILSNKSLIGSENLNWTRKEKMMRIIEE
jgi:hypothetical protein